jgi:hypothetical protein
MQPWPPVLDSNYYLVLNHEAIYPNLDLDLLQVSWTETNSVPRLSSSKLSQSSTSLSMPKNDGNIYVQLLANHLTKSRKKPTWAQQ